MGNNSSNEANSNSSNPITTTTTTTAVDSANLEQHYMKVFQAITRERPIDTMILLKQQSLQMISEQTDEGKISYPIV